MIYDEIKSTVKKLNTFMKEVRTEEVPKLIGGIDVLFADLSRVKQKKGPGKTKLRDD